MAATTHYIGFAYGFNIRVLDTLDINSPISISKVGPEITSLAFNDRGGLMAYSDTKGEIKLKEIAKKLYIRNFTNHSKAVYALDFIPKSTLLVSGGDDLMAQVMDFATGRVMHSIKNQHTDFIRTVMSFESQPNIVLTGSFDKKVKLFDLREVANPKMVFKCEAEVEDGKVFRGDVSMVTVGGKYVSTL